MNLKNFPIPLNLPQSSDDTKSVPGRIIPLGHSLVMGNLPGFQKSAISITFMGVNTNRQPAGTITGSPACRTLDKYDNSVDKNKWE
jgi:hypothetical protein